MTTDTLTADADTDEFLPAPAATTPADPPRDELGREAYIGMNVWYIHDEGNGKLVSLPGRLYAQPALINCPPGCWNVIVERGNYRLFKHNANYCGKDWRLGGWCFENEKPA